MERSGSFNTFSSGHLSSVFITGGEQLCRGESIESNFNTILYAAAMCVWNGIWKIYENA